MKYAPVKIPTLCRSRHFIRLIESLKRNAWAKYTDIYVGIDYPPSDKYRKGWQEICNYVDNGDFSVFASFNVRKREANYGARKNSIDLSNWIYEKHDRQIYMEDDLEVSPNFLEFMDKCLDAFENDPEIVTVSGYSYPIDWLISEGATCMKQDFNASAWGRGSWKSKTDVYADYIKSGQMLGDVKKVVRTKSYKKMIDASLREYIPAAMSPKFYQSKMLKSATDIGLRAYLAVRGKYCISPVISKVRNHGFDGSGLYCQDIVQINGQTAGSYNYPLQPIDESVNFEIQLNDERYLEENRQKLNVFDKRTFAQMQETKRLLWLAENWGVGGSKLYKCSMIPIELIIRLYKKLRKKC